MTRKGLMLVPLIGLVGIMQLLYFWLMNDSPCANVVYVFITLVSVANAGLGGWLWFTKDARRATPVLLSGALFVVGTGILGGVLLCTNATVRTGAFSLGIVALIYAVIETMLIFTMEPDRCIDGVFDRYSDDDDFGPDPDDGDDDYDDDLEPVEYQPNKNRMSMSNNSTGNQAVNVPVRTRVQQPYSAVRNQYPQMPSNGSNRGSARVNTVAGPYTNVSVSQMPQAPMPAQSSRVQRPMPMNEYSNEYSNMGNASYANMPYTRVTRNNNAM